MTITLPPSPKAVFLGLFGRKQHVRGKMAAPQNLGPHDVARLFQKGADREVVKSDRPAKLNEKEKQERATLSSLRGALYSKD